MMNIVQFHVFICMFVINVGCLKGRPTTPTVSVNQNPDVGETVTLTCSGSTSTTVPTDHGLSLKYSWMIDGTTIPADSRYSYTSSKHQLTILPVQVNDAKKQFTCQSTENVISGLTSASSTQKSFIVYYGPDDAHINKSSPYILTEGNTEITIACSSDCYPSCSFYWTNMTGNSRTGIDGVISIAKVTRYDAGIYRCIASNSAIEYSKTASSTVTVVVNFKMSWNTSNKVRCIAKGIPSTYHFQPVQQIIDGKVIPHNHAYVPGQTSEHVLDIPSLQLHDTGTYTCNVSNGIADTGGQLDLTDSVDITVHVSPKILTNVVQFISSLAKSVNMTIPFYCYPAVSGVTLMRPDQTVVTNDSRHTLSNHTGNVRTQLYGVDVTLVGNIFQFYVTNLQDKDFTNYTLRLQNDVGHAEIVIALVAESKPHPQQLFRFLGLIDRVPHFYWRKGFNGGHKQYFVIETSPFGTDDWSDQVQVDEDDSRFYLQPMQSYFANITGLSPGKYYARLIAGNELGLTEASTWLQTTFSIPKQDIEPDKGTQDSLGAVVGGTGAAVVITVVCVAVVLVYIQRRRRVKGNNEHQDAIATGRDGSQASTNRGTTTSGKMHSSGVKSLSSNFDSVSPSYKVDTSDPLSQYTTLADTDGTSNRTSRNTSFHQSLREFENITKTVT